ncbi:helix-turn-helix domain-containing protein [Defluviimonas sp. WL0024]|uniref:Helix-turn-helix domain-containing protein n=1 Tax=Albidovulum salinarum TaxID=2984153 RepID=A0ABT2X5Q0_9RHOB|nr:S24 family peptidase [Defluviimonas sp. WL0024]MCU9849268.1 helix-turn-helix domain-containing protein [Defluviimonas sp. WL0024]
MSEQHTLADRLRARADQLGLTPAHVAEMAEVNRSFVYDILRGRSARPGIDKLAEVARVLKVDRDWLIHGIGEVEGEPPFVANPDETFVAIAHASPRPSMGGGTVVTLDHEPAGRAYHFRRSWIKGSLKASPSQLRIMHVEGDSMEPTLLEGDTVLVDMTRRAPNPPGIFVLDDGIGLVAKRLEHIPNSDPPAVRVISDNKHYPEYERTADEIHIVGRIRWFAREI